MDNLYSIGDVSRIKDITIKALRYYHKMGILTPAHIDEKSGYRYYSLDQFIYIDIIKGCRSLGTSIEDLQKIFKQRDTDVLLKFLQLKRVEAEESILKMKEIIKDIDDLSTTVNNSKYLITEAQITLVYFKEREIIVVPCIEVGQLREVLYYSDLDKIAKNHGVDLAMERGLIYEVSPTGNANVKYAFSTFDTTNEMKELEHIKVLPSGNYLTLTFNKFNEESQMKKLINYIEENHIEVKLLLEVELFNDLFNTKTYSCQLQVYIGD